MSDDSQQPIVVKRVKKGGAGAHGGAWKIAYADFVTAMMAFFLLMWLLGSTSKGDLKGIADYFAMPLSVALSAGTGTGQSASLIEGGNPNLTRNFGQVKSAEGDAKNKVLDLNKAKQEFERQERQKLESVKNDLQALIEASPVLQQFKNQLLLDLTTEGLRIQIVDEKNRPMFDSASSELKPYTKIILEEIGKVLNKVDNRISISGHTDAAPYAGGAGSFGNWELSTNRANAARRELIVGGMDAGKVMRVNGMASTVLYDKADPYNPINRRIAIIVLNKKTEEAILRDGQEAPVTDAAEAAQAVAPLPPAAEVAAPAAKP